MNEEDYSQSCQKADDGHYNKTASDGTAGDLSELTKKCYRDNGQEQHGETAALPPETLWEAAPSEAPSGGASSSDAKVNSSTCETTVQTEQDLRKRLNVDNPTFEDALNIVGTCGYWQLKVFLLASFSGFCTAIHNLVYAFIGAVPDHWCRLPHIDGMSNAAVKKLLIPIVNGKPSKCSHFQFMWNFTSGSIQVDNGTTVTCSEFEYDRSEFISTIPTQWNLVCDDASWASAVQMVYMLGILVGSPVLGTVSDRLGRKTALLIAVILFAATSPLVAFSPNFGSLIALRFLLALGSPGIYATSYVLAIEVFEEKLRGRGGCYFSFPFAIGYVALPGFAYFLRDWQHLQLALSVPPVFLLVTWAFLPESPRWLLRQGKLQQAEEVLVKAAKMNGKEANIPPDFAGMLKQIAAQEAHTISGGKQWSSCVSNSVRTCMSIVKSSQIRLRFTILCVCWGVVGMTYYGLALNSANIFTSRYMYTFIGGLVEFPSILLVPELVERYGRKITLIGVLFGCGSSLLISSVFHDGSSIITLLTYVGKFMIGASFTVLYLYSTELLPTVVRTYGIGVASMVARIGAAVAPLIVDVVGRDYHHTYPSIIFGCCTIAAGMCAFRLPETKNCPLPDTISEVELGHIDSNTENKGYDE